MLAEIAFFTHLFLLDYFIIVWTQFYVLLQTTFRFIQLSDIPRIGKICEIRAFTIKRVSVYRENLAAVNVLRYKPTYLSA